MSLKLSRSTWHLRLASVASLILLTCTVQARGKPLPDLVVPNVTAPSSATPGSSISVIYTVRNQGEGNAAGSTVGCMLSGPSGTMSLGTAAVKGLQSGRSVTSSMSVTIPGGLAGGSYTLTMTADVSGAVQESSEANNTKSVPLTIVTAGSGEALLTWNPNPEPDLAGYRTHYGTASHAYTSHTDVGNVTTFTEDQLLSGFTYYFAVSAYNEGGFESAHSNEASKHIP